MLEVDNRQGAQIPKHSSRCCILVGNERLHQRHSLELLMIQTYNLDTICMSEQIGRGRSRFGFGQLLLPSFFMHCPVSMNTGCAGHGAEQR